MTASHLPDYCFLSEGEEIRRYFCRGDAILRDLQATCCSTDEEGDTLGRRDASLLMTLSSPAAHHRSRDDNNEVGRRDCFTHSLSEIAVDLEELRVEGARNPFLEDDAVQQEISEATREFLLQNTSSSSLIIKPVASSLIIKPVALRATDMLPRDERRGGRRE